MNGKVPDLTVGDWAWRLAATVARPVGLLLVLLICATSIFAVTLKINTTYKSIVTQLLLPLSAMLALLLVGILILFWQQQQRLLDQQIESSRLLVKTDLSDTLEQQTRSLSILQALISSDSNLHKTLRAHDASQLLTDWQPTFQTLKTEFQINSLSFLDENMLTILSINTPDKYGGRLVSFTEQQAKNSRKAASGLELTPAGTLSLQVVQPVFFEGQLAGYLEISKPFNALLLAMKPPNNTQLAVILHKKNLNQDQWEADLPIDQRQSDWERFPNSVITFSTSAWLTEVFSVMDRQITSEQIQDRTGPEIASAEKDWQVASASLQDASGKDIGELLMLIDITSDKVTFDQRMAMAEGISAVLLALILGFTYIKIIRADKLVMRQKAKIREGENQFRSMFLNHSASMLLIQQGSGQILDANNAASQFYGYPVEQLKTMKIQELNTRSPKQVAMEMVRAQTGQKNYFHFQHKLASGDVRDVEVYSTPIDFDEKFVLFSIIHDITDRNQVQQVIKTEKEALAKLLLVSEEFLANSELNINYQKITDDILQISGGKYAVFNLFDENGLDFQTVAVAGLSKHFRKATSILGFDLYGKKWPRDEIRTSKTRDQTITRFPSLLDLSGSVIPQATMAVVKKLFHPGETVVAKILTGEQMLGDFTIVMPFGEIFGADNLVSIYIHQVGLLLQRKRAEALLRISQHSYRHLVEQVPEVIYTDQIGGNWQYLAPNILDMCGYSVQELIADPALWQRLIPEPERQLVAKIIQSLKAGDVMNIEYPIQTRQRGLIWVHDHGVVKADGAGKLSINGLLEDISERKRIEAELVGSEKRFRGLFDDSPISLWEEDFSAIKQRLDILSAEGVDDFEAYLLSHPEVVEECLTLVKVIDVNKATLHLFGAASKIELMNNMATIFPEGTRISFRDELVQIAAGNTCFKFESVNRSLTGTLISVEINWALVSGYENDLSKVIVSMLDITSQKIAAEAIKVSEAKFKAIIDSSPSGIGMASMDGKMMLMSDSLATMYGYAPAEKNSFLGKHLFEFIDPSSHEQLKDQMKKLHIGQISGITEYVAIKKDGTRFFIDSNATILQDSEGKASGRIFVQRDISDRKHAEAEILEANRLLEESTTRANQLARQAEMANTSKSEFLANMSHEIRTPMNGVIGMTSLLMETDLTEEQRRYAETVRSSAEALLSLINDILDFSKVEAGKLELESLDFDLLELLDDFSESQALGAHEKGLELLCFADPDVPASVQGDPGRLRQILTNLVGNAIKFTPAGEVAVRVHRLRPSQPGLADKIELLFTIRDTGIGIPPEKIGLLFNKFTQADTSTTRKYGGTGLGLAISKQLVELMDGEIGVKSPDRLEPIHQPNPLVEPKDTPGLGSDLTGTGTEFWFRIQMALQSKGSTGSLSELPAAASLKGIRILVVDDNATSREVLNVWLRSWGMRPTETVDGKSALSALTSAQEQGDAFQIAILDMQMPGMDGAMLGEAIKNNQLLATTRLVLLSSLGDRGDTLRFEKIGFAAYLNKPLRPGNLFYALGDILAGQDKPSKVRRMVTSSSRREIAKITAKEGVRILLVEDNITNQQVALGILKNFGLAADAVATGLEALQALTDIPYSLVLMDVQMPEMDGLEATRRIRDIQSAVLNHNIPIVAMTANAMQEDRAHCLEAGMNDYISKPVKPNTLADALHRWLSPAQPGKDPINPSQMSPQPVLDSPETQTKTNRLPEFDKAGMMERLMDDHELIHIAINSFLQETPIQIQALKDLLEINDVDGSTRLAHTIKGSASVLGGEVLRGTAQEMEKFGNQGDLTSIRERLDEMDLQFASLAEALKRELEI